MDRRFEKSFGGLQPSYSRKWGTGKPNKTDGWKGLLKWGVYIGATACRDLVHMKKQKKNIPTGVQPTPHHYAEA